MSSKNVVAIFDFDRTLITKDSFRIFSLRAAKSVWEKGLVLMLATLCKVGVFDNRVYKERVLAKVWSNKNEEEKSKILRMFYTTIHKIENSSVLRMLKQHLADADTVVVISASPEFYLKPFVKTWSKDIIVFGTKVQYLNGRIAVDNLYGKSKGVLARSLIKQYKPASLLVYTDHISDLSIIELSTNVRLVSPSGRCLRMLRKLDIKFEIVYP